MTDIYQNSIFSYTISDEEKIAILDQLSKELNLKYEITKKEDPLIIFSKDDFKKEYNYESVWGCIPPLSNIKYIYEELAKRFNGICLNQEFDESETGKLCQTVHLKHI